MSSPCLQLACRPLLQLQRPPVRHRCGEWSAKVELCDGAQLVHLFEHGRLVARVVPRRVDGGRWTWGRATTTACMQSSRLDRRGGATRQRARSARPFSPPTGRCCTFLCGGCAGYAPSMRRVARSRGSLVLAVKIQLKSARHPFSLPTVSTVYFGSVGDDSLMPLLHARLSNESCRKEASARVRVRLGRVGLIVLARASEHAPRNNMITIDHTVILASQRSCLSVLVQLPQARLA